MTRARQLLCAAGFLFCLVTGGASGAYYLGLHTLSNSFSLASLPQIAAPAAASGERILILSPHCDDETLGLGGFIADARRAGTPVTVAFLTNGDGFRVAASRTLREVNPGPADYVRFAEKRQEESLGSLRELGVEEKDVRFLGYPDQGLKSLWENNWDADHPFRSAFTRAARSPYKRNYSPDAVYCGASLLADISRLMGEVRPTTILVTHPADDHPDHSLAAAFAQAALRRCQAETSTGDWAKTARLRYYIVHRGDWPLPQGSYPDKPLLPPPGLVTRDTQWNVYPLSPNARQNKARALGHYVSQMNITGRFLSSFVRTNELVADLRDPEVTAPLLTVASLSRDAFADTVQSAASGYGDNFARAADPAADLTAVAVHADGANRLRVQVTVRGKVSPRVRYSVRIRVLGAGASTKFVSLNFPVAPDLAHLNTLEMTVERSTLGATGDADCLWVQAETRWANRLLVDATGYRPFSLR